MQNYYDTIGYTPITIASNSEVPYLQYALYREAVENKVDQPGELSKEFSLGSTKRPLTGVAFRVTFMFTDLLNKFTSITGDTLTSLWKPTLTVVPTVGLRTSINLGWDVSSDNFALVKAGRTKQISLFRPYSLYTNVYTRANLNALPVGPIILSLEKTPSTSYNGVGIGILGVDALVRKGG